MSRPIDELVRISSEGVVLEGRLQATEGVRLVIVFAHGSGSSRHSPRNNTVAGALRLFGCGTLLIDLLTPGEDKEYQNRFDIDLLAGRLMDATRWLGAHGATKGMGFGYFGASTGAAAALKAAAGLGSGIAAIVSRGGRPDLAMSDLPSVSAPTLLIVGERDETVLALNRQAYDRLTCRKELAVIPGATHLFEESGALEEVARLAASWFTSA